jgi:EAL domain-containing protein (putative c-di-GMP-specific phosphodiesterase class I)/GGDEF domain-containing protein
LLLFLAVPIAVQSRWPVSIDTAPLLVAAVVAIALRLIVEARHRVRLAELRDAETALPNERALVSALEEAGDTWLCLTAASIERFEAIRSALASSDVADLVALAAARIERVVGSSVYRLAPDTLAWLAPTERDPEKDCVEISDSFARPVQVATTAIDTAWTYGLAATTRETSPTQLVERALAAVTDARARGRTRQWFQGVAADALRDLSLMGELRSGIDQDQLFVAYQPKLHLQSGRIAHAEALVRWRHPTEGLMPPDRFMPLAEATGVVREITRFVLRRTIAECLDPKSSSSPIAVSVNVSAADIGQPDFANEVILTLADARVDPARLTLEITESAIIRSKDTALRVLDELRDHGIRLSIDDYGTGQSTLSYLKTLPVSELKIDKMFVTRLCENESDRIMVRSTIDLAHQLGLTVVAEGAEDWDTVMLLTEFGCDYAQGFVIGRAVSMQELRSLADTEFKRAA